MRIVTSLRSILLIVAALLTAGHPCMSALSVEGICPMSDCSTPGRAIGSADCCCAPSNTAAEVRTVSALVAPAAAPAGSTVAPVLPGPAVLLPSAGSSRFPEAVPLFLKNAALLI